jgi:hypothetical protein
LNLTSKPEDLPVQEFLLKDGTTAGCDLSTRTVWSDMPRGN